MGVAPGPTANQKWSALIFKNPKTFFKNMFGHEQFFPAPLDTDAQKVAKLTRFSAAQLGVNGSTAVTGTDPVYPALGQDAFVILEAAEDTVIATLESVAPDGTFTTQTAVSLAAGQRMVGYFTSVTLTSGSVNAFPIPSNENSPAVPGMTGSYDVDSGDVTLTIFRRSGGDAPTGVQVQGKPGSDPYADLLEGPEGEVDGSASIVVTPSKGITMKYRAYYQEPYDSGVSRGRRGAYSNEVTLAIPSDDADLSALVVSAGALDPVFDAGTVAYDVATTDANTSVTATVDEAHAAITVKINTAAYVPAISGVALTGLSLHSGANTLLVKVTAQDGVTVKIYTLTITKS